MWTTAAAKLWPTATWNTKAAYANGPQDDAIRSDETADEPTGQPPRIRCYDAQRVECFGRFKPPVCDVPVRDVVERPGDCRLSRFKYLSKSSSLSWTIAVCSADIFWSWRLVTCSFSRHSFDDLWFMYGRYTVVYTCRKPISFVTYTIYFGEVYVCNMSYTRVYIFQYTTVYIY